MKIGKVTLKNNIFLAPLAGVTYNAYRLLCMEYGAGLTYAPIINQDAILNNPDKAIDIVRAETLVAAQLIGADSQKLSKAGEILESRAQIIDLNCGCPRSKEVKHGYGADLLRKPDKIKKLVSKLVSSVSVPVTVKIRLGFGEVNVMDVARVIEDAGASAITLHARTAQQDYGVKAQWAWIKKVKEAVNIPVIGNGDVFTPVDVKRMIDETGCDGVMIGRGAVGNPFIFKDSLEYLNKGVMPVMAGFSERVACLNRFIQLYREWRKPYSLSEIKQFALCLTKGLPGSRSIRNELMKSNNESEFECIFKSRIIP